MKTTGQIIRAQRESKGLLLRQVASKLDIDTAILSKIERGVRKPSRELIIRIAEVLGLNKDSLIIQFISEKIAYEIADEKLGLQILKESEKKYKLVKKV